ncbi:hypothetical protein A9K71_14575 [Mesorhizobium sp. WSM3873]|nr:hypothetical protein A9K71_14575 [Mesorhizobium sp. WSM3873]
MLDLSDPPWTALRAMMIAEEGCGARAAESGDDPSMIRPAATIWTTKAPRWACIDTSLPNFEGQPPPLA